ncbi:MULTISPECIES: hypothetical protein [unclassified Luteococcus]|uniref:hypothetical protein n=1 Tax=unclassified Luteococcus TaxID=2639923 RepID=UPI00313BE90D
MTEPVAGEHQDRTPTFGETLSGYLAHHPMSLDQLSRELGRLGTPLSTATLSYWCTGRSLPSRPRSKQAVVHLERLLELAPGSLVSALPGPLNASWSPGVGMSDPGRVLALVAGWGLDIDRHVGVRMTTDRALLGADRRGMRQDCFQLQWGEAPATERMPIAVPLPTPDAEAVEVLGDHGCPVGRSAVLDSLLVMELVLDRPLLRGDLRQLHYRIRWQCQTPIAALTRRVPLVMDMVVLSVRFQGEPPGRVRHVLRREDDTPASAVELTAGREVQQCLSAAPVGLHQLVWDGEQSDV